MVILWRNDLHNFKYEDMRDYIEYYAKNFSMHGYYIIDPMLFGPPVGPFQADQLGDVTLEPIRTYALKQNFRMELNLIPNEHNTKNNTKL